MAVCQVADLSLRNWLPCPFRESGGRQCERAEAHEDGNHYFSPHTIAHDMAGNGWDCQSFWEPVNTVAYRARLVDTIEELTEELEYLDS